ncbi:dolichol kinase [Collariella sp. IMI 366227]|nr:dolichol kinase [Collariella sp. IMI 366227]
MPEHLQPPTAPTGPDSADEDYAILRILSRSPHPYHRQSSELLEPSDRIAYPASTPCFPSFARESPLASESGTEADDEHFLKGLPAPKARLHKGLRGKNEHLSGASTPLLSPAVLEEEGRKTQPGYNGNTRCEREKRGVAESVRRRRELVRRATEVLLLVCQAGMVASNPDVQPLLRVYREAPLLYPFLIPIFVTLLVAKNVQGAVLPSLVLAICALPRPVIPGARYGEYLSSTHWLLSCIPFSLDKLTSTTLTYGESEMPKEVLVLLYPLHQTLCLILQHLTTTSLLVSELQLLSGSLISLLLLATSPQAVILKTVLWGGGLGLLVSCSQVIQWGITLARVPKWRFRRATPSAGGAFSFPLLRECLPRRYRSSSRTSYSAFSDVDSLDEYLNDQPPARTTRAGSLSDVELTPATLANIPTIQSATLETSYQNPARRQTHPITTTTTNKSTTPPAGANAPPPHPPRTHRLGLGYLLGDIPSFRFQIVSSNLERWILLPLAPTPPHPISAGSPTPYPPPLGPATTRLFLSLHYAITIILGLSVVLHLTPTYEIDTRRKVFHFMMVGMFYQLGNDNVVVPVVLWTCVKSLGV